MQVVAAVILELALLAATVLMLGGRAGTSDTVAVASGAVLMAALAVPAVHVLRWSRRRTNAEFLSAVVGVMLGKLVVVSAAVLFVWKATSLPRLEFIWGLMAGWVLSFLALAAALGVGRRRRDGESGGVAPAGNPGKPVTTDGRAATTRG